VFWQIVLLAARFECKGRRVTRSEIRVQIPLVVPRTVSALTVFGMKALREAGYNKSEV